MNKALSAILLLILTLVLVIDYFPQLISFSLDNFTIFIILMILIVFSYILGKKQNSESGLKELFIFQLITPIYIFILVIVLTLLGGESTTIISLNDIFFWIIIIISLAEAYSTFKKIKTNKRYTT